MLLSSISNLSTKEVFLKVKEHLLLQNKQSWLEDNSSCAYRGKDGLKCAVGCLITDEEYTPDIEGNSIESLHIAVLVDIKHYDILERLQLIHDETHPSFWKEKLDKIEQTLL